MLHCIAPVLLLGYLSVLPVNSSHTSRVDGAVLEVQTCERGFGVYVKAAPGPGLYGAGGQYGLRLYDAGRFTSTFSTKLGISQATQTYRELPMDTQFELSAQFLIGWDAMRFGVQWWHMSNAGLQSPNIGLDMLVVQTGWVF